MEIILRGEPKEIAALVLELQERRTIQNLPDSMELCFDQNKIIESALAAIHGMRGVNSD